MGAEEALLTDTPFRHLSLADTLPHLRRGVGAVPNNTAGVFLWASILDAQGRMEDAVSLYQFVLQVDPFQMQAYVRLCELDKAALAEDVLVLPEALEAIATAFEEAGGDAMPVAAAEAARSQAQLHAMVQAGSGHPHVSSLVMPHGEAAGAGAAAARPLVGASAIGRASRAPLAASMAAARAAAAAIKSEFGPAPDRVTIAAAGFPGMPLPPAPSAPPSGNSAIAGGIPDSAQGSMAHRGTKAGPAASSAAVPEHKLRAPPLRPRKTAVGRAADLSADSLRAGTDPFDAGISSLAPPFAEGLGLEAGLASGASGGPVSQLAGHFGTVAVASPVSRFLLGSGKHSGTLSPSSLGALAAGAVSRIPSPVPSPITPAQRIREAAAGRSVAYSGSATALHRQVAVASASGMRPAGPSPLANAPWGGLPAVGMRAAPLLLPLAPGSPAGAALHRAETAAASRAQISEASAAGAASARKRSADGGVIVGASADATPSTAWPELDLTDPLASGSHPLHVARHSAMLTAASVVAAATVSAAVRPVQTQQPIGIGGAAAAPPAGAKPALSSAAPSCEPTPIRRFPGLQTPARSGSGPSAASSGALFAAPRTGHGTEAPTAGFEEALAAASVAFSPFTPRSRTSVQMHRGSSAARVRGSALASDSASPSSARPRTRASMAALQAVTSSSASSTPTGHHGGILCGPVPASAASALHDAAHTPEASRRALPSATAVAIEVADASDDVGSVVAAIAPEEAAVAAACGAQLLGLRRVLEMLRGVGTVLYWQGQFRADRVEEGLRELLPAKLRETAWAHGMNGVAQFHAGHYKKVGRSVSHAWLVATIV